MTLVQKIKELCDSNGTNFAALERALGFGGGSIRKWDSATPAGDRLAKVADYFNVSVDYLLGREKSSDLSELEGTYFRLAKGAKELELTDADVDAILNLYKRHQERNK